MTKIVDAVGKNKSNTNPHLWKSNAFFLAYLHAHGVVHRDIKPENILLQTNDPLNLFNLKLSDFGLVTWVDNCTMMEHVVGTPMYMAPEILQSLPYSAQCDIWSIGVLMYLLLCGYSREVEKLLHMMIVEGKIDYPPLFFKSISPGGIKNFIILNPY
jgi:serine/threonine kinase 33